VHNSTPLSVRVQDHNVDGKTTRTTENRNRTDRWSRPENYPYTWWAQVAHSEK